MYGSTTTSLRYFRLAVVLDRKMKESISEKASILDYPEPKASHLVVEHLQIMNVCILLAIVESR